MNLELYLPDIRCTSKSVFGNSEKSIAHTDSAIQDNAILRAFLDDDDVQHITVASANIGFIRTFEKSFIPRAAATVSE